MSNIFFVLYHCHSELVYFVYFFYFIEKTLPAIISRYDSRDIYNADEFGLFYKTLPTKSMHLKEEKCSGDKNSKIRLTGLAAANMSGEKSNVCYREIKQTPLL